MRKRGLSEREQILRLKEKHERNPMMQEQKGRPEKHQVMEN